MNIIRVVVNKLICGLSGHLVVKPSVLPTLISALLSPTTNWVCLRCMETGDVAANFYAETPFEREVKRGT